MTRRLARILFLSSRCDYSSTKKWEKERRKQEQIENGKGSDVSKSYCIKCSRWTETDTNRIKLKKRKHECYNMIFCIVFASKPYNLWGQPIMTLPSSSLDWHISLVTNGTVARCRQAPTTSLLFYSAPNCRSLSSSQGKVPGETAQTNTTKLFVSFPQG